MRTHTKDYKNAISTFGRELDSKITIIGSDLILGKEDLYSVVPITNADLLKTVMKEVDFESQLQIGEGQEVNIKSGIKVNGEYEYINYGNYFVYKSEYKAETNTYSHICYDRMIKTMIDYTPLDITYPISLKEYINAIAIKCGIEFANLDDDFVNSSVEVNEDHFSNSTYTFRDVLDYVAQLVGGWFCINDDDKLEIRYPSQAKNYASVSGEEEITFETEVEDKIEELAIDGNSIQATRSGKNLCSVNNVSGTRMVENLINTIPAGTYTFSAICESNDTYSSKCLVYDITNAKELGRISRGTRQSFTFTLSAPMEIIAVYASTSYAEGADDTFSFTDIQIEEGTTATEYEPYGISPSPDYPSEIESVGTYNEETGKYEIEVKNTGNNLYNISDKTQDISGEITVDKEGWITASYDNSSGTTTKYLNYWTKLSNKLQTSKKYIVFTEIKEVSGNGTLTVVSNNASSQFASSVGYSFVNLVLGDVKRNTITTKSDFSSVSYMLRTFVSFSAGQSGSITFRISVLEDISITTDDFVYEPYKESTTLFSLDQPLRSLPNGVKDIAYIKNNILYVDRYVGSVVLDGSESWNKLQIGSTGKYYFRYVPSDLGQVTSNPSVLSNYFVQSTTWSEQSIGIWFDKNLIIKTEGSLNNTETLDEFKTWLSEHNTQVDYELAEPYTETIGEVDLLSTFKGTNNITLSANISTNMSITYTQEYEEVDRQFLKDVNVSFSKKYGSVNSVVFSRGGGSDNLYRKDYDSISANGLTEIKITDNPFLEGSDRENFIQALFDKLNGLEFYIMDVSSTGITYLELGDLYYFNMSEDKPSLKAGLVQAGLRKAQGSSLGKYICLMLNDEINITQGLSESIYVDEPEITETDYKTASITDQSIKNAIIQTNKNSAEILLKVNNDEVVSAINLSPEKIKIQSSKIDVDGVLSVLGTAGSTVINGANITTGSISCDRLKGGTLSGQKIVGGSISITTGNYYFNMGTSTSNPNCSGLNVGSYGVKAYSDITATGFAITDSDIGKSGTFILRHSNGTSVVYLTFTGGILTAYDQLD